jgi:hypothetical protein
MSICEIASTVWGAYNDARFWDGFRTYGDRWAKNYLLAAIRRGADRLGSEEKVRAADAALNRWGKGE